MLTREWEISTFHSGSVLHRGYFQYNNYFRKENRNCKFCFSLFGFLQKKLEGKENVERVEMVGETVKERR